jgi:hypothetical protein
MISGGTKKKKSKTKSKSISKSMKSLYNQNKYGGCDTCGESTGMNPEDMSTGGACKCGVSKSEWDKHYEGMPINGGCQECGCGHETKEECIANNCSCPNSKVGGQEGQESPRKRRNREQNPSLFTPRAEYVVEEDDAWVAPPSSTLDDIDKGYLKDDQREELWNVLIDEATKYMSHQNSVSKQDIENINKNFEDGTADNIMKEVDRLLTNDTGGIDGGKRHHIMSNINTVELIAINKYCPSIKSMITKFTTEFYPKNSKSLDTMQKTLRTRLLEICSHLYCNVSDIKLPNINDPTSTAYSQRLSNIEKYYSTVIAICYIFIILDSSSQHRFNDIEFVEFKHKFYTHIYHNYVIINRNDKTNKGWRSVLLLLDASGISSNSSGFLSYLFDSMNEYGNGKKGENNTSFLNIAEYNTLKNRMDNMINNYLNYSTIKGDVDDKITFNMHEISNANSYFKLMDESINNHTKLNKMQTSSTLGIYIYMLRLYYKSFLRNSLIKLIFNNDEAGDLDLMNDVHIANYADKLNNKEFATKLLKVIKTSIKPFLTTELTQSEYVFITRIKDLKGLDSSNKQVMVNTMQLLDIFMIHINTQNQSSDDNSSANSNANNTISTIVNRIINNQVNRYNQTIVELLEKSSTKQTLQNMKQSLEERMYSSTDRLMTYVKVRNDYSESPSYRYEVTGGPRNDNLKILKIKYMNNSTKYYDEKGKLYDEHKASKNTEAGLSRERDTYIYGPFTQVFGSGKDVTHDKMLKNMGDLVSRLNDPIGNKDVPPRNKICIVGYGVSGTGKTSMLLHKKEVIRDGKQITTLEEGIIPKLVNLFGIPQLPGKGLPVNKKYTNLYKKFNVKDPVTNKPIIIHDKTKYDRLYLSMVEIMHPLNKTDKTAVYVAGQSAVNNQLHSGRYNAPFESYPIYVDDGEVLEYHNMWKKLSERYNWKGDQKFENNLELSRTNLKIQKLKSKRFLYDFKTFGFKMNDNKETGDWRLRGLHKRIQVKIADQVDPEIIENDMTLGAYIKAVMESQRLIRATTNNDVSSRSHFIIYLRLGRSDIMETKDKKHLKAECKECFDCEDKIKADLISKNKDIDEDTLFGELDSKKEYENITAEMGVCGECNAFKESHSYYKAMARYITRQKIIDGKIKSFNPSFDTTYDKIKSHLTIINDTDYDTVDKDKLAKVELAKQKLSVPKAEFEKYLMKNYPAGCTGTWKSQIGMFHPNPENYNNSQSAMSQDQDSNMETAQTQCVSCMSETIIKNCKNLDEMKHCYDMVYRDQCAHKCFTTTFHMPVITICDFAGVENKFRCRDEGTLDAFKNKEINAGVNAGKLAYQEQLNRSIGEHTNKITNSIKYISTNIRGLRLSKYGNDSSDGKFVYITNNYNLDQFNISINTTSEPQYIDEQYVKDFKKLTTVQLLEEAYKNPNSINEHLKISKNSNISNYPVYTYANIQSGKFKEPLTIHNGEIPNLHIFNDMIKLIKNEQNLEQNIENATGLMMAIEYLFKTEQGNANATKNGIRSNNGLLMGPKSNESMSWNPRNTDKNYTSNMYEILTMGVDKNPDNKKIGHVKTVEFGKYPNVFDDGIKQYFDASPVANILAMFSHEDSTPYEAFYKTGNVDTNIENVGDISNIDKAINITTIISETVKDAEGNDKIVNKEQITKTEITKRHMLINTYLLPAVIGLKTTTLHESDILLKDWMIGVLFYTILNKMMDEKMGDICDTRLSEGEYINESLSGFKKFIVNSLKNDPLSKPKFAPECVPIQCNVMFNKCFDYSIDYDNKETSFSKSIESEINHYFNVYNMYDSSDKRVEFVNNNGENETRMVKPDVFDTMQMCIINIINVSKDKDNPPKVRYINLNGLLLELEKLSKYTEFQFIKDKDSTVKKITEDAYELSQKIEVPQVVSGAPVDDAYISNNPNESYLGPMLQLKRDLEDMIEKKVIIPNVNDWIDRIKNFEDSATMSYGNIILMYKSLVSEISTYNASSLLGTMEVIDSFAKRRANSLTCFVPHTSKLKDIMTKTNKFEGRYISNIYKLMYSKYNNKFQTNETSLV